MKKFYLVSLIFFLVFTISNLKAQEEFQSPRKTYKYFIENSQEDDFISASEALKIKKKNQDVNPGKLAKKLYMVFKIKLLIFGYDEIPNEANYVDSTNKKNEFILSETPFISLEKIEDKWFFSSKTTENIDLIYKEYYPFTLSEYISELPEAFHYKLFGVVLIWQILAFLILLLIAVIIYFILKVIINKVIIGVATKTKLEEIADDIILPVSKPISYIIVVVFLIVTLPLIDFSFGIYNILSKILQAFIPAFSMVLGYRISDIVARFLSKQAAKTQTTVDDHLIPFAKKLMKVVVVVFGLIYILQVFNVSIAPLLAGISIGGLAFALAAQDTVKNLFGSLTIFTDQPFKIGDWIVFDGVEGTVIEIGIRSSRVRTFYDSIISVPNGKLSDIKIDNMGERQYRRYFTKLIMTYDSDIDKLEQYVKKLREIVANHPKTRKDYYNIYINEFGEKGIIIMFYIFIDVPDWSQELEARHELIVSALKEAKKLDLRFAYPIMDYSKEFLFKKQ